MLLYLCEVGEGRGPGDGEAGWLGGPGDGDQVGAGEGGQHWPAAVGTARYQGDVGLQVLTK